MKTLLETAKEISPLIAPYVTEEETNRRLSDPVIKILKSAGFHRLFVPKSQGGMEADPLTVASLIEEIAHHNTAAAWSMMVANVSAWWNSRLPEKGIEEIYKNGPDALVAGALHPPMMATPVEGGYRINGRTPLASNIHEAHWIFVSAFVLENGQVKMTNGIPEIIGVVMKPETCEILDNWHTIGMKATDSSDVVAQDVFVPQHLLFPLAPEFEPNKYYQGKLYKFAAIGASIVSLIAPVALAVARNAIEELKVLADKKTAFGSMVTLRERGAIQRKLGMAEALVQSSRAFLFQTLESTWKMVLNGEILSLRNKADLLLAATHTNQSCVQAVDLMYSSAGTTGIYTKNKLAHYFMDAQVIRQHGFANDSRYETVAQVYLGLQPDLPVLAF